MAIVNCKECGHAVSTGARVCPNCGYSPNERCASCYYCDGEYNDCRFSDKQPEDAACPAFTYDDWD